MFTTTEAAAILGLAPRTVTRHIERGNLRATKRGRDLFLSLEEIERFQRERRRSGRPARHQEEQAR